MKSAGIFAHGLLATFPAMDKYHKDGRRGIDEKAALADEPGKAMTAASEGFALYNIPSKRAGFNAAGYRRASLKFSSCTPFLKSPVSATRTRVEPGLSKNTAMCRFTDQECVHDLIIT
jgi:hypothetical protein